MGEVVVMEGRDIVDMIEDVSEVVWIRIVERVMVEEWRIKDVMVRKDKGVRRDGLEERRIGRRESMRMEIRVREVRDRIEFVEMIDWG